jgi:peptidoglycan-N-acetylglucosamine deacetylase
VLSEHGVQASFGITGAFASEHPDHIVRMAREGHVVMNHSDSHFSFTGVSSDDVLLDTASRQADLLAADAVLAPLIGHSTAPYWRPPFGDYDASVLADVGAIGYGTTVMWTVDSLGWRGLSAEEITARVLDRAEPGAILMMHVGSQSADALALPAVIDGLRAEGYRFTTIANATSPWPAHWSRPGRSRRTTWPLAHDSSVEMPSRRSQRYEQPGS